MTWTRPAPRLGSEPTRSSGGVTRRRTWPVDDRDPGRLFPKVHLPAVSSRAGRWSGRSRKGRSNGQGRGHSLQDDQGDEIAAALDRPHAGGWSVGDTAFHDVDRGGIIHVVIGSNGENQIRAEGATRPEAWRRALCFTAHRTLIH